MFAEEYLIDLVRAYLPRRVLVPPLLRKDGAPAGAKAPCLLGGILHGLKPVPSTDKPNISSHSVAREWAAGVAVGETGRAFTR